MKEFEVLEHVGKTASSRMKVSTLKQYDSPRLRAILKATYDPFKSYRVKKLDIPTKFNSVSVDILDELLQVLDILAAHSVTPAQGRTLIKNVMSKTTEEDSKWIAKITSRDLKIGISEGSINRAFKGLIPTFKVMLAHPVVEPKSGNSRWDDFKFPCAIEHKLDGMRCIAICDGTKVQFKTREGHDLEALDYLASQVLALKPGCAFVIDGEILGSVFYPECKTAKKNKDAGKNWVFAQGISMARSGKGTYSESAMLNHLVFKVWDIVDYDYFMSHGEKGECKALKFRKSELAGLFERQSNLRGLAMMESILVKNKEEAVDFFTKIVAEGGEGAMIKELDSLYEFDRSYKMLKIKAFYPADLRIIGAFEGKLGTRHEGSLGGLILGDDAKLKSECGTGIDDDLRLEMWFRHKAGKLVGGIVEVLYQEITADNSLRLPIFVRERPDKTTVSFQ